MKNSNPIKKFTIDGDKFIYSVGTNKFFKISDIAYDVIDYRNENNISNIRASLKNKYSIQAIRKTKTALEGISSRSDFDGNIMATKLAMIDSPQEYSYKIHNQMHEILLNMTTECNMACKYCIFSGSYDRKVKSSPPFMDLATANKSIDFLLNHSKDSKSLRIGFYGGEPFLNFAVMNDTILYANNIVDDKKRISFYVVTNGTLINSEKAKWCIDNNIDLIVSLDGPRVLHNRYRNFKNGKGSYDRIIGNLFRIKSINEDYYNKRISFLMVCAPPYNFAEIHKYCISNELITAKMIIKSLKSDNGGYFDSLGREEMNNNDMEYQLLSAMVFNNTNEDNADKKEKSWANSIRRSFGFERIINREMGNNINSDVHMNICRSSEHRCFISSDGTIFPCEKISQRQYMEIGNIYDGFYQSQKYETRGYELKHLFFKIIQNCCGDCWAFRFCDFNSCYIAAQGRNCFSEKRMLLNCEAIRRTIERNCEIFLKWQNQKAK